MTTIRQVSFETGAVSAPNVKNRSLFIENDDLDVKRGINSDCAFESSLYLWGRTPSASCL